MDFAHTDKVRALQSRVAAFMAAHVYPNKQRFHDEVNTGDRWERNRLIEELKVKRPRRSHVR